MIESLLPFVSIVIVTALVLIVIMLRQIVQTAKLINDEELMLLKRLESILDRIQLGDEVVAKGLADSVARADATVGPDGAASDASLRTRDTAEAITKRQRGAK